MRKLRCFVKEQILHNHAIHRGECFSHVLGVGV